MSQLNVSRNQVSPDQIYFDITATNLQSTTTLPPIFYYNEARSFPFVEKPEDYNLSIMRFTVETGTLPVFIPTIARGADNPDNDPNLTIYSVTLQLVDRSNPFNIEYKEFVTTPVYWRPQDQSIPIPTTAGDNTFGYYNCYSYQYLTYLVQEALNSSYWMLNASLGIYNDNNFTAIQRVNPATVPPLFMWDTLREAAYFVVETTGYVETKTQNVPIFVSDNASANKGVLFGIGEANGLFSNVVSDVSTSNQLNISSDSFLGGIMKKIGSGLQTVGKSINPIFTVGKIIKAIPDHNGTFLGGSTNRGSLHVALPNKGIAIRNDPTPTPTTINGLGGREKIDVFFNASLFELFSSFPSISNGYDTELSNYGRNFRLLFCNMNGANEQEYTPSVPYAGIDATADLTPFIGLKVEQEYSTIYNMSSITSLVFCSNTLPIYPNLVASPIIYDNGVVQPSSLNAATSNIITDMTVNDGNYRPFVVYEPSAEYRLVSLHGNRPLYNLDLSIFFKTKFGELIPFTLASGASVTIKLAFLKKSTQ